jgi:hypothetical protein
LCGHVQALLDVRQMNSINTQVVSKDSLDGLMAPIVEGAAENLMGLSDPDFAFVPEKLRRGMKAVHDRLREELKALFELRTVYDDLGVCRILAQEYPWQKGGLTHYEHLRLAWSQLARLNIGFNRYMDEVSEHHSEALELFSADLEPADADARLDRAGYKSGAVDCRGRPVDRWYQVAPRQDIATAVAHLRVASEWPDTLPPFIQYYDAARSELLREIDEEIAMAGASLTRFLENSGAALLDMIGRYNNMVKNFQRLHEEKPSK